MRLALGGWLVVMLAAGWLEVLWPQHEAAVGRLHRVGQAQLVRDAALLPFRQGEVRHAFGAGEVGYELPAIHALNLGQLVLNVKTACPKTFRPVGARLSGMAKRVGAQQLKEMVARRLKTVREDVGLTQEQFAARLGISQTRYSKYESGRSAPPLAILAQLPAVTGRSLDYIVAGAQLRPGETAEGRPFTPQPHAPPPT